MRRATTRLIAVIGLLAGPGAGPLAAQAPTPPAFSATAVQTMPDGSEQSGRIVKSGTNMRMEFGANAQKSVQIMRGAEGLAILLDPARAIYAVIPDPTVRAAVEGTPTPCPTPEQMQAAQIRCQRTGEGVVSGITAERWEISGPQDETPSVVLWDPGRRQALSRIFPDGTSLEMTFQAMQEHEGRQVEYWSTSLQIPGQAPLMGGWWFDPELLLAVREEMPGGISRRLTDIQVGPVDQALFAPPEGFSQVEPQAMQPQAGARQ